MLFIQNCKKNDEPLHGIVTFTYGNLKINNQGASVGNRVKENDCLKTSDNSLAVVQISQTAVITLRSNTELKFNNLAVKNDTSQDISLYQNSGSTFHKVIKKGTAYSVKTPTVTASVRGTSFNVIIGEGSSRVSLLNGKVNVASQVEKLNEVVLNPGEYVDAAQDKISDISRIPADDAEKLTQLDSISAVADADKLTPQKTDTGIPPVYDVIPESVKENLLKDDVRDKPADKTGSEKKGEYIPDTKAVKALIKKENRTVEDIKTVFNRIDEITLFSGRVIKGAISERGEKYSVITTDGVMNISEKEIQRVRVLK